MKTTAPRRTLAALVLGLAATAANAANPAPAAGTATASVMPGRLGVVIDATRSAHALGDRLAGATVAEVFPGSPADAAGLGVGDRILALDGTRVSGASTRAFRTRVLSVAAGEHRRLTVRRADGRVATLDLVAAP